MKFTLTALAVISFLSTATLSHPTEPVFKRQDDPSLQCTGESYETCVSDVFCAASYPESCYCANDNKRRCATACGVSIAAIQFQDCDAPPAEESEEEKQSREQKECFDGCVSVQRCISSWPTGCYCENDVKTKCALRCGKDLSNFFKLMGELQDCGGDAAAPTED